MDSCPRKDFCGPLEPGLTGLKNMNCHDYDCCGVYQYAKCDLCMIDICDPDKVARNMSGLYLSPGQIEAKQKRILFQTIKTLAVLNPVSPTSGRDLIAVAEAQWKRKHRFDLPTHLLR